MKKFIVLAIIGMCMLSANVYAQSEQSNEKLGSELVGSTYACSLWKEKNKKEEYVSYTWYYSFLSNGDGIFYEKFGPSKTLDGYFRWSDGIKNYESDVAPTITTPNSKWFVEEYTPKKWDEEKKQKVVDEDDNRDRKVVMICADEKESWFYYNKSDTSHLSDNGGTTHYFIKQ